MPNRILKESINESVSLSDVSPFAQDLFKRLITYADDYGRFNAGPDMILARLYPRELMSVDLDDIRSALFELVGEGKVKVYRASATASRWRGDVEFGYMPGWSDHQRIRQAKHKNPDPDSEEVNDVYLRRHIPKDLKTAIFRRDKAVCQCCKKDFSLPGVAPDRAMRLLSGVLHFDHVVPVSQGGRATYENLRLACASCNLSRPKTVDPHEVLADCENSPQVAANFRLNPIQSNPIQSESKEDAAVAAPVLAEEKRAGKKVDAEACPADVSSSVWADFLKLRKANKAPLSQTALDGLKREAEKAGITLQAALEICCAKGWRGFEASWLTRSQGQAIPLTAKPSRMPTPENFAEKRYGSGGLL